MTWSFIWAAGAVILNCVILVAIRFNDMKHLEKESKSHSSHISELYQRLDSLAQRISKVEGRLNGTH